MRSLPRMLSAWTGKARPIEIPFTDWQDRVDFRSGDLAILAGAPGGGKSLVSTNWAWQTQEPVLYLAQDSPRSVLSRFVALDLSIDTKKVNARELNEWSQEVQQRENLLISVGAHSLATLREKLTAYHEWWGGPPTVVFIDNLIDMAEGTHMEHSFYARVLPELKQIAIEHDVGMVLLHHVTRGDQNDEHGMGESPLKMRDLLFAGERESRHVWGVYRAAQNRLNVQVLKQQDGEANPNGHLRIPLEWDREAGRLYSIERNYYRNGGRDDEED